jgi:Tol biopolymer transport system component
MTSRHNLRIASLLLATVLSACGGGGDSTAPPTTGTLDFNVVTTGVDIDADGFLLTVDGGSPQAIPANGTLSISNLPGSHTLTISGLAFNCDVNTAPASAAVTAGKATQVDIRASCTPYLRNAIVYVSDQFNNGEVMVMRPDGSRTERLSIDQVGYSEPVVAPDGQSIAVSSRVGGGWNGIYLLDRFGKGRTTLVSHSGSGAPAWSPDGTKLSFSGTLPGPYGDYGRIFIVNRDGTGLRQLSPEVAPTDPYVYDAGSSWSPDGTRLVFDRMGKLFLINADGTGLVSTGVSGANPAWSPDGTQIAYGSINLDGIWVMDMSFTPRRLTTAVQQDEYPVWSPDGRQLVFERLENNVFHLYKVGADGSSATRLGNMPQNEYEPSWSRNF